MHFFCLRPPKGSCGDAHLANIFAALLAGAIAEFEPCKEQARFDPIMGGSHVCSEGTWAWHVEACQFTVNDIDAAGHHLSVCSCNSERRLADGGQTRMCRTAKSQIKNCKWLKTLVYASVLVLLLFIFSVHINFQVAL